MDGILSLGETPEWLCELDAVVTSQWVKFQHWVNCHFKVPKDKQFNKYTENCVENTDQIFFARRESP